MTAHQLVDTAVVDTALFGAASAASAATAEAAPVDQVARTEACDLVDAPLDAGLAALEHMRRRGRRMGPVAVSGDRLLVLLAPGSAEEVPRLLHWLGWGHLDGVLRARTGTAELEALLPRQHGDSRPSGLDLRTQELPRMLDTFADACARAQLDRSISRSPSRRPHGRDSARGHGR
ncbi:hypothetical protein ABIA33_000094 [Streptacidiphilus sp. MAP12-16]|uniref:hypothetical protein n=1 Tax=Streptacidiphilus sp. MAP12-16 TaxID=3156300 RepID=UPI00351156B1